MSNEANKPIKVTYEFPDLHPHEKLRELILYIAKNSEGDQTFGKVKLAKILYYTDFLSYRDYGQPVTGSGYKKLQFGPVPVHFFDLLDQMLQTGDIFVRKEKAFENATYDYDRVMAVREADLLEFTGRDIALVNDLIKRFWKKSATEISEQSHGIAWQLVELNETIPYEASLLSDESLSDSEMEWALRIAQEYGLQ